VFEIEPINKLQLALAQITTPYFDSLFSFAISKSNGLFFPLSFFSMTKIAVKTAEVRLAPLFSFPPAEGDRSSTFMMRL